MVNEVHSLSDRGHNLGPNYRCIVNIVKLRSEGMLTMSTNVTDHDRVCDTVVSLLGNIEGIRIHS